MNVPKFALPFLAMAIAISGCSASHVPQTEQSGAPLSTPKSVSPALIHPAPMAKTAVLPASAMTSLTQHKPMGSVGGLNYAQIAGAASYAAASTDGSLWVLSTQPAGADKYIWHYANGNWTNISGLASKIAVGPSGVLFAINSNGGAYSYYNGAWSAFGGGCRDLTVASDGTLYVISNGGGADGAIWQYGKNGTTQWAQMPGSGNRIAASWDANSYAIPGGTITPGGFYVINSLGSIYYLSGSTYIQFPGAASAVVPINGGVFVLGYPVNPSGNALCYYDLTNPGWSAANGAGVSASSDGRTLYVIGAAGGIYYASLAITTGKITEYPVPTASSSPNGIAAGSDDNMWFTELWGNNVAKITTSGAVTEYPLPKNPSEPGSITAGPDGNLWFTESFTGLIGRVTPAGSVSTLPIVPSGNPDPFAITTGADGNLWIAQDNAIAIAVMTPTGATTYYQQPPPYYYLSDVTAGPDGNVWFVESQGNVVGNVTPSGVFTEYPVPTASAAPNYIAAGGDGNLWFTESAANKIGKVTPGGAITEYPIPTASSSPEGIAKGPTGDLWFTEARGNKIGEITVGGVITEYPIPTASADPAQIAKGPDGNMWFTEFGANKIGKITP